jgi:hypothetical protein
MTRGPMFNYLTSNAKPKSDVVKCIFDVVYWIMNINSMEFGHTQSFLPARVKV